MLSDASARLERVLVALALSVSPRRGVAGRRCGPAPALIRSSSRAMTFAGSGDGAAGRSARSGRAAGPLGALQARFSGQGLVSGRVRLGDGAPAGELLALYVERAAAISRCSSMATSSSAAAAWPSRSPAIAPTAVHPVAERAVDVGHNTLDLRIAGYAQGGSDRSRTRPGCPELQIGPQTMLARAHAQHYFWSVTWPNATGFGLIGVGFVLLAVGWLNRHEVYFSISASSAWPGSCCRRRIRRATIRGATRSPSSC